MSEKILEVKDLQVNFRTYAGISHAVRGVDFYLNRGGNTCDRWRVRMRKDSYIESDYGVASGIEYRY